MLPLPPFVKKKKNTAEILQIPALPAVNSSEQTGHTADRKVS